MLGVPVWEPQVQGGQSRERVDHARGSVVEIQRQWVEWGLGRRVKRGPRRDRGIWGLPTL